MCTYSSYKGEGVWMSHQWLMCPWCNSIHVSSVVGFGESLSVVLGLLSSRLGLDGGGTGHPSMGGAVCE